MTFPNTPGSVHYVQTPFRATSAHQKISITFRISSSSDAVYNGRVDPDAWDPATFHVFLERRGDDLTKEYFRWWAAEGVYVLGSQDNSVVTIEIPLSADKWISVFGHHNEAEFSNTLKDLGWVGITFGGSNFYGHGVNMRSGVSTFTLLDYRVE
jgi:hypothetical protein